eukprot:scaffold139155_cov14-Tisochrysis_lutea.AAC.2
MCTRPINKFFRSSMTSAHQQGIRRKCPGQNLNLSSSACGNHHIKEGAFMLSDLPSIAAYE